jgi:hypothetical protein
MKKKIIAMLLAFLGRIFARRLPEASQHFERGIDQIHPDPEQRKQQVSQALRKKETAARRAANPKIR